MSRRLALLALLLVVVSAMARPAAAQTPADRQRLDRFRDSIAAVTDSMALLRLEQTLIAGAKVDRSNAVRHLQLGFLSLRLGDLGGRRHYDDAASEFQWAIDLKPEWPYPWYGMGLAELGIGDSQVSIVAGIQTMLGKDALSRSAAAFAKSADVDPTFAHGLVELANTALRQRVNIRLGVALDALRRAGAGGRPLHPDVLLARGRVEREVGDADSALAAFNGYLARGANKGLAHLEIARTRFLQGTLDGAPDYYAAAGDDDSAVVSAIRTDLAYIATEPELRRFDAARGQARADFLRRFWLDHGGASLRSGDERLQEHYRRLAYARRNFFLATTNRHYQIEERYRSGSQEFDDRGIIYIRHGAPTDRASLPATNGVEPNESWRYARTDGDLIFHFVAREDVQDFKLVESVFDILGFASAVYLRDQSGLDNNSAAVDLLTSRDRLSPIYGKIQGSGGVSSGQFQNQERRIGQRSIAVGTTSDSYELSFARPLKVEGTALAVGSDSGRSAVQLAYAIAGQGLDPVMTERGAIYTIRVRFVATDDAGRVVAAVDTTRRKLAAQPVPPAEWLVDRIALPMPPGVYQYRLAVQSGEDAGVVLPRDSVRVEPTTAPALALSDLVLGAARINLAWHPTPQDTVLFNPLRTYLRTDPMALYYEVHGLTPGETITTELVVRKTSGAPGAYKKFFGGSGALNIKSEGQATAASEPFQRTLSLEKLKPGMYVLGVAITDQHGRTDWRWQPFELVER